MAGRRRVVQFLKNSLTLTNLNKARRSLCPNQSFTHRINSTLIKALSEDFKKLDYVELAIWSIP